VRRRKSGSGGGSSSSSSGFIDVLAAEAIYIYLIFSLYIHTYIQRSMEQESFIKLLKTSGKIYKS
jgi:hypothetical protein